MLNVSQFLTSIKMDLGIYGLALPFENPDQSILDSVKLRTIPTFSQYIPYVMRVNIELATLNCIQSNYQESIYELDEIFGDRKVLGIRKLTPRNKMITSSYVGHILDDNVDIYGSIMMAQVNANLASAITPPISFNFRHPNLMILHNVASMATEVVVEFNLEHTENLATIPNTSWELFYELATLDIKKFLFNALKHHRDIQTAYGTITLKIDDWESSDADRKELLQNWKERYHLDADQFVII